MGKERGEKKTGKLNADGDDMKYHSGVEQGKAASKYKFISVL